MDLPCPVCRQPVVSAGTPAPGTGQRSGLNAPIAVETAMCATCGAELQRPLAPGGGGWKVTKMPEMVGCAVCRRTGACGNCHGSGFSQVDQGSNAPCEQCGGSKQCYACFGRGKIPRRLSGV